MALTRYHLELPRNKILLRRVKSASGEDASAKNRFVLSAFVIGRLLLYPKNARIDKQKNKIYDKIYVALANARLFSGAPQKNIRG